MKTYFTKAVLTLLLSVYSGAQVYAQGTAFTYHGRLNNNGAPVTGAYDMQFAVYDAEAGGALVAGAPPINALGVINGLFTARIDFGPGVFTGPARWLEISVRPAGNGNFVILSPRQELTSSPYSIRAQSAGTAADVSNGSVVKSLNTLKDNITLLGGTNVTISPNGNTLTIASAGAGGSGIWSVNNNNAYYTAGNVGIGSSQPNHRLRVSGGPLWTASSWKGTIELDNASAIAWNANAAGNRFGIGQSGGGLYFFNSASDPGTAGSPANYLMTIDDLGNVGIGTPFPATRLTVHNSLYGIEHTDGNVRLSTYVDGIGGWLGTVSNHKLHFYVNDGTASMTIDTARNVGMGTTSPQAKLHLYHSSFSQALRIETTAGVNAWSRTEYVNPNGQWNVGTSQSYNGDQFYIARQGSPSIALGIQPNGDAYLQGTMNCKVLTITGGADIAEPFQVSSGEIPKGSVVVIDDENPGQLKLSTQAYDTRVAGVVSGANGIKPGISLHQEAALDGDQNVALSGRVYVQTDAAFGPIRPGDLLTTSATPGHAMKVSDHAKARGAILGKAMSGLKHGQGMVLVLVTLQ